MGTQNALNNQLFFGVGGFKINTLANDVAAGDLFFLNANREFIRLAVGSSGLALVSNGTGLSYANPTPGGNAGGDFTGQYPNPTIAPDAVDFSRMQNVNPNTILGRLTAGTGDLEMLTPAQGRSVLGLGNAATLNTGTVQGAIPLIGAGNTLDPAIIPKSVVTSVQPVADQAARLALTTAPDGSAISIGDCAKQLDNGITYMLAALPASTNTNWISIGDTSIDASDVQSGIFSPDRLATGVRNGTKYLRDDGTWQTIATGTTARVAVSGTTQQMSNNVIYHYNNASKGTFTLPTTAAAGDRMEIWGVGNGGWAIAQNAGQQVRWLELITTAGVTGRVDCNIPGVGIVTPHATCILECVVPNTLWLMHANGQLDIV